MLFGKINIAVLNKQGDGKNNNKCKTVQFIKTILNYLQLQ